MNQTQIPKKTISVQERRVSLFLLAVLVLIAGVVLALQYRYDAGQWREHSKAVATVEEAGGSQEEIAGLLPLSSAEQYDATTLSDKINGKAELYLSAGFKELKSRRFGFSSDTGRWLERFVYKMEGFRSAYSVFSTQRRSDVAPLKSGGGEDAYIAANGLFMVHGPFYVEIIASEDSDEMRARMQDLAQAFIAGHTVADSVLEELTMFPVPGRIANSRVLVAADAFGMDGLNWVFTARYVEKNKEATAFISLRASATEADKMARAFVQYWRDYGGEAVVLPKAWADYRTITILDNYEIVQIEGNYLVGIHESTDLDFGLSLIQRLQQRVREVRHDD